MFASIGTFQTEQKLNDEFYIYECGHEDVKPRDPYQYEPVDYYLLHYIIEGEGFFFINDEVHHLGPKDGFIIPPHTENNYYPLAKNPWSYRWIGFKGSKCQELFQQCGLLTPTGQGIENFTYRYNDVNRINAYFKNVFDFSDGQKPYAALGESYHLLNALMEQHQEELRHQVTDSEKYVHQAVDIIDQQFSDPLFTIDTLASTIQLERSYLYRLFKQYLNLSPKNYLIQQRMKKSAELLRKSSYSIEEIAYIIGLNNPSHYSRQFSKYKGLSPSRYRLQFKTIRSE